VKIQIIVLAGLLIVSCIRNKDGHHHQPTDEKNIFEVTEVVNGGSYSYIKVKENSEERWIATGRQEIAIGDVFYYDEALQMTNFHSKDLDRTFEVIYFVNQISKIPIDHNHLSHENHGMDQLVTHAHTGKPNQKKINEITLEKAENEITIAHLYEKMDDFSAKEVEIRGIVVKINKGILGKNWVHLQDGTNSNGSYDLTITTQDAPEINDEVVFKGVITLKKDFGAGYIYDIIMEDAEILQKSIL
jgi:hypothetical protein